METKTIRLNSGLNIFFRQQGAPGAEPLVLMHGWPSSSLLWRNIMPELSKSFLVIAPDLPGYGQSDKPLDLDHDLDFLHTFIKEFLDALSLKKIYLAAHDIGGMAALSFAAGHPELINKFIIMNTAPYADISFQLKLSLFLLKQPLLTWFFLNPFVFRQVLKTGIYNHDAITDELVKIFQDPWKSRPKGHQSFTKTIDTPIKDMVQSPDRLKSITLETLILWGKKDRFFPFSTARRLHQDIENSTLVGIENAGHFCQEEEPEFIARMIRRFIENKNL